MARVFEALQRAQKHKKNNGEHDPLAAVTGTPATVGHDETNGFELPGLIGTPNGPRSNEGLLLPGGIARLQAEATPASNSSLLLPDHGKATTLPVVASG